MQYQNKKETQKNNWNSTRHYEESVVGKRNMHNRLRRVGKMKKKELKQESSLCEWLEEQV